MRETNNGNKMGILGMSSDPSYASNWLNCGADGFISKMSIVSSEGRESFYSSIDNVLKKYEC